MPRTISARRKDIERTLIQRIGGEHYAPGCKFMSNRAVASEFGINILTAQRILNDLAEEGRLDRRPCSGTFVPGAVTKYSRVNLLFNQMGRKAGSFKAEVLKGLSARLSEEKIPWKLTWLERGKRTLPGEYCVTCELNSGRIDRELALMRRHGLLIGGIPSSGIHASHFDSVAVDDFNAGVLAGRYFREHVHCRSLAILANPPGQYVWAERYTQGFRSIWPRARILHPASWSARSAPEYLKKLFSRSYDGLLCSFWRQVLDVNEYCARHHLTPPAMVALSKPPVPPHFQVPLITVSLNEVVETAMRIISNRIAGDMSPTVHLTLAPKIVR